MTVHYWVFRTRRKEKWISMVQALLEAEMNRLAQDSWYKKRL